MSGLIDLLTDRGVLVSVAVAVAVVALPAAARFKVPASLAWVPAVLVALWEVGTELLDRYQPPLRSYHPLSGPLIALGVVVLAVAAYQSRPRGGPPGTRLTVFMAAAAAGVFLCVPETGLLRLFPGPLVVLAVAVVLGLARPMGVPGALGLALPLAWISIVDGQARDTALLGAAACFASAWLLVVASGGWRPTSRPEPDGRNHLMQLAALALAVLVTSRLAAMIGSVVVFVTATAVVQMMAAGVLWQLVGSQPAPVPVEERR